MRKIILSLCTLAIALTLSACSAFSGFWLGNDYSDDGNIQISPTSNTELSAQAAVTLYYRFQDQDKLASLSKKLNVLSDERIETLVIQQLLQGPGEERPEYSALFSSGVRLLGISNASGYLFVTLSGEFLSVPGDAPADWENQQFWRERIMRERRLAVYAIVNSITELGKFSRVQILVDVDGTGIGQRISRKQLGFLGEGEEELMEPIGRQQDVILTPGNTARALLTALQSRDIDTAYLYFTQKDVDGEETARPTLEDFSAEMSAVVNTLENFEVLNETTSRDGSGAVVCVNLRIRLKDGSTKELINIPIRCIRESDLWKVPYTALQTLLLRE